MKHTFRFLANYDETNQVWNLTEEECQHFHRVLRLEDGAVIEVFDGKGLQDRGPATVESKTSIKLHSSQDLNQQERNQKLSLAMGAIKPSDFEDILPGLVELGVDRIFVFLQDGVEKKRTSEKVQIRWQRILVAACKQAKRAWFPEIICLHRLDDLAPHLGEWDTKILMDDQGERFAKFDNSGAAIAVIGSEKGLSSEELELLNSWGFAKTAMSPYILRSRTAALAVSALLGSQLLV